MRAPCRGQTLEYYLLKIKIVNFFCAPGKFIKIFTKKPSFEFAQIKFVLNTFYFA